MKLVNPAIRTRSSSCSASLPPRFTFAANGMGAGDGGTGEGLEGESRPCLRKVTLDSSLLSTLDFSLSFSLPFVVLSSAVSFSLPLLVLGVNVAKSSVGGDVELDFFDRVAVRMLCSNDDLIR